MPPFARSIACLVLLLLQGATARGNATPHLQFEGGSGPGEGKHIVLISGDEEYRSEEALPQLAQILSEQHGFKTTVLFAIDPEGGYINPNHRANIPGTEVLDEADLVVLFTRFRQLPDEAMSALDRYLRAGKPIVGIRTATHAFLFPDDSAWSHYSNAYQGDKQAWEGGFGRLVLGERWVSHHGDHKDSSTRGVVDDQASDHPIARGIETGDIWASTDVYGVRLPLPGDSQPIIRGEVLLRGRPMRSDDVHYGMRPGSGSPAADGRNDPLMPIAWARTYQLPGGEKGRAFTSTVGSSADLLNEGVRRLLVNACFWCLDMEGQIPDEGTSVKLVGEYQPTKFEFREDSYWHDKKLRPEDMK